MKIKTWALNMTGYDCKIQYLKGGVKVCADLWSRVVDRTKKNDDFPVDIDNRNYVICTLNLNLFKLKECVSCKNVEDPAMTHKRPSLQEIDVIREQESDKDI